MGQEVESYIVERMRSSCMWSSHDNRHVLEPIRLFIGSSKRHVAHGDDSEVAAATS